MKRNRINNDKKYIYGLTTILLVFSVFMISLGWSFFTQSLNIGDISASVRVNADIRVTEVSVDKTFDDGASSWEDYNVKSISSGIFLPEKDSTVTYRVQITNFGNVEMGILKITGLPEELDYELGEGYSLKDKICVASSCKSGIQKDIYVTIKYKDNKYNPDNLQYGITLNIDFRPFHTVTYTNFLINTNTDEYPKEILEGDVLKVKFPSDILQKDIKVFINKIDTKFQYVNNFLQVENVSGNVVVQYRTLADRIVQLADNKKTCNYNGNESLLLTTDSPCNGSGGVNDPPPYNTYFLGTNDCLNFNYVWYSGYMWRITEILNDGSVKMISENILSAINFGETGFFDNSYIKQWLNEDFLDTLYNHKNILVEDATWDISNRYDWCYVAPLQQPKASVGLMNPYEFSKTASYSKDSFLNLGHAWWLSSYSDPQNDPPKTVSGIHYDGTITGWAVPNNAFGVRPMVVLKADVKFSGEGTQENPFVLLDDIKAAQPGDQINTRTPGELVMVNDMLYRIVNTHKEDGKLVTKLKSANYVKDSDGNVIIKKFGEMNMHSYADVVNSENEDYWGAYLNGTWLEQQGIKKYLVEDTYYVDNVQKAPTDSTIGSYKNTICKEKNTTETTKDCVRTDKTWKGYVGLPIVGELFAYPLGGNDVHDYKTATMTPYGDGSWPMIGAFESETQGIFQEPYEHTFAVKPTITLSEDVIIESGDGKTPATAFKIALP